MKWTGRIILAGLMVACGAVPMAAANGRLFLSLTNGKLECWSEK